MRVRVLIPMLFITITSLLSHTNASGLNASSVDSITSTFDYIAWDPKILKRYIVYYDNMNGAIRDGWAQYINKRVHENKLSFEQCMTLMSFFKDRRVKNKTLNDYAKQLQRDVAIKIPQILEPMISVHSEIMVSDGFAGLWFRPVLLKIFNDLSNLDIVDITGIISLKQLFNTTEDIHTIRLEDNQLQSLNIFRDLNEFPKLRSLYLHNNRLSNIDALRTIRGRGLVGLWLSTNKITDINALRELTTLEILDLEENRISDINILSELKGLQYLYLNSNHISNIDALRELRALVRLRLGQNVVSNITALRELKQLEWLTLSNNRIEDITVLNGLKQLKYLYIYNNDITDIAPLRELTNLQSLFLGQNKIPNIYAFPELKRLIRTHLPELQQQKSNDKGCCQM